MGIKLSTNFDIGAPVPVDSKLVVSTKAGLTTINENIWPEGYLTICLEDKQLYVFNKTNEVDAETGKFRKVAADIDTSLFEKKAQGFMTLEQYNVLKDAGNIIEDVDYYIEDATEDGEANKAINVSYDNANTTLSAVNVQEALTELNTKKQDIVHYTIMPDPNTLEVGAIIQYIGITNEQYKEGRFYKVIEVGGAKSYNVVDTCAKDYELKSEPMTQLEYDALEQLGEVDPNKSYYIEDGLVKDIPTDASTIAYNNAVSGLNTSNVQGAIDLLQSEKQPKGHYALKSQIPDTSNFVTKAVSNLINYYSKQQTYTKEEVQSLLTNFSTLKMKIVDTLPSSGIETNVIYLIKDTGVDSYTQYAYINDVWATLGKTTVDLSNYYTKDESDSNFITESELNTALTDYIKSADLSVIAEQVSFDNADNGFTANNVQDALEELKESKQDALSVEQVNALDSGITADKVAQIQDNTDALAETLQFKTTDVTDADELYTENGLYILNTQTVANLPTAEDSMGYCVEVIRYGAADDALVVQVAYRGRPTDEHPLYMRRRYAGVWSDWVGAASINDEAVNTYATLSSEKINAIAAQLQANIDAKASIDDSVTALTSTWSSDKISKELGSKTYTTLGELGLDASATLDDVLLAMPNGSSALLSVTDFTNYQSIFPYTEANDEWSRVYIVKSNAISKAYVVWFRKDGAKYAIANVNNSNQVAGWKEMASVADHNMKTYTNVTQLGLTSPCSVIDIIKVLPKSSQLIYGSYGDEAHRGGYITDAPAAHGLLEIQKSDYDGCRTTMTFTESATNSMGYRRKWVAELASSLATLTPDRIKWHEVAYKAVADVDFTTINQTNGLTAPTGIAMTDSSKINYCIRNGICYVHIALQISSITAKVNSWTVIADLPKSVIEAVGAMNCEGNTVPECMPIRVSQAGKLTLMYKGTTTSTSDWWSYSFSYPVVAQ